MASLSKRQRKEVDERIRSLIAPEWKVEQGNHAITYITRTNDGGGDDLFASITQGVGASNRIGDSIRVHRIDIWAHWYAPWEPPFPECWGVELFYRDGTEAGGALPSSVGAFYDSTLTPGSSTVWFGPCPKKLDLKERGWHIKKINRFKLLGAALTDEKGWDSKDAAIQNFQAESRTVVGTDAAGLIALADVPAFAGLPGGVAAHPAQPFTGRYMNHYRGIHKHSFSFPNGGLKVDFVNAALGLAAKNHIYYMKTSNTNDGSPNENSPQLYWSHRVWFTDD